MPGADREPSAEDELRRRREVSEIYEAIALATSDPHSVVEVLRTAAGPDAACRELQARYGLSEVQSLAVLDTQLRRVTAEEREKIEQRRQELAATVRDQDDRRLRPARAEDLPAILRYERDYVETIEPESAAGWAAAIDQNLALWIECLPTTVVLDLPDDEDADPVGFAMWQHDGDTATLVSIQVAVRHRRTGLGSTLLRAFEQRATAAGARVLALGVHRNNPAQALYARAGYVDAGRDGDYLLLERRDGFG